MKPVSGFLLVSHLQEELNRLFEEALTGAPGELEGASGPRLDVIETADAVVVLAEAAGLSRADLSVVVERNEVVLSGERAPTRPDESAARYHCMERPRGRFSRRLRLPCPVDAGGASAVLRDGVLRVELPKIDERRGRPVRVEIGRHEDAEE